ncbi:MAG TPA: F0F1 ATP synthase subunit gamma [Puia sp.]|nr:F0F1 ATP synthase subunit gamma [Puia sp.]
MTDSLDNLRHRIAGVRELGSVVRNMKAIAASGIRQSEMAVEALWDYQHAVNLGLAACLARVKSSRTRFPGIRPGAAIGSVVMGSDLGLVGRFNDGIATFAAGKLLALRGTKTTWICGENVRPLLEESGFMISNCSPMPGSVKAITATVAGLLLQMEEFLDAHPFARVLVFYNRIHSTGLPVPVCRQLMPLPQKLWHMDQPSAPGPELVDGLDVNLGALVREYLFVAMYRACAASLAAEHVCRLAAMQRAEKKIREMTGELTASYNRLRQGSIDEELFDVIAGTQAARK